MNTIATKHFSPDEIEQETDRLFCCLLNVHCQSGKKWTLAQCREIAPITLEILALKKEKNAIILAHSYVEPEIVYGIADFKSDSYALSLEARHSQANIIVFAGVVFMAETAKIVCPDATVLVPDPNSGCSLADSITPQDVDQLREKYPEAAIVCYINTSAEVKAACDVCVTSGNAEKIIQRLPNQDIVFLPDKLMANNIIINLRSVGSSKNIITFDGSCEVHEGFDPALIEKERARYPGLKVVSHPECDVEITKKSDFVGSTGQMMAYVKQTPGSYFMLLTECGLVSRLEVEVPDKHFIASCKLCPYMKLNSLEKIRQVLQNPRAEQIITLDPKIRVKAKRTLDRMFELAK